ncbi:acyltransferase, partial [Shigella dysenteriae]|nr:acyltransferase [Shigella dysenteriae]EFP7034907.1 acyltransferase [Shigella dysenteriae]EFW3899331.1 acyltransferase [Shigella dysenteriae]
DGPFSGPHLSVAYFFIISGFVLTHAHRADESIIKYFLTRFVRLWPLTFISTMSMVLIYYFYSITGTGYIPGNFVFEPSVIIKNLTFLHGVASFDFQLINAPTWSIGIEFWASLFVPVVFMKLPDYVRFILACIICVVLMFVSDVGISNSTLHGMYSFYLAIACMMLGSGAYGVLRRSSNVILHMPHKEIFMWAAFIFVLIGVYAQPYSKNRLDFFFIAGFIPLIAIDFLDDTSLIKRVFHSEIVQFLGYISFPLYLLHFPVMITGIAWRGSDSMILGVLMMCFASIFISYLYAAYVDIPMYKYLKRKINVLFPMKE